MYQAIQERAKGHKDDLVALTQALIRTPSLSGEESALADLLVSRMQQLGYDAFVDGAGNAVGILKAGDGPVVLYNTHMDHVDPGDEAHWQHPPYEGVLADGFLHGRGASDAKGALACQIYAGALLKDLGLLKGTFVVGGVVLEELGGSFGTRHLLEVTLPEKGIQPELVVLGSPTGLDICLGHRGRAELEVTTYGRTSHGSAPWLAINAINKMTPVIEALEQLAATLPSHPFLEKSTLAVTKIECSPGRLSIVPDRCTISIDRRFLPSEGLEEILGQIQAILGRLSQKDPTFKATVRFAEEDENSYTGLTKQVVKVLPPFLSDAEDASVLKAVSALTATQGYAVFAKWFNGTDGSYTSGVHGIPTFGYSPGEEKYSHSPFDRVRLENLVAAVAGTAAIHVAMGETSP